MKKLFFLLLLVPFIGSAQQVTDSITFRFSNGDVKYYIVKAASNQSASGTGTVTPTAMPALITVTPTGNITFNAPASGMVAGQRTTFVITTSGTTSRTLTWGTGFKSIGTLATGTVSGKIFSISFIYDGTNNVETGRTAAQ